MIRPNRLVSLALAALLSAPAAALAQNALPTTVSAAPGKTAQQRVEQRIRELQAQLQITPAEEAQWNLFATTMRENAAQMDRALTQRGRQYASMNALQNLQSYAELAQDHAQQLQKLAAAFGNLYDAMPEQQKRMADEAFRENTEKHIEKGKAGHKTD